MPPQPSRLPSGGTGETPSAGGCLPGLGKLGIPAIISIIILVLVVLFICPRLTSGGPAPATVVPAVVGTATPMPTAIPVSTAATGQRWLVMLYQNADDKVLEQDIYVDLNEAERAGSTDAVQVVAQIDRFQGGFSGDGNWTSAHRYYVTKDNDLSRVGSQVVQDLGEVNMSDGHTLVDFITWAMRTYPVDRYVLIMSDHGMGWPGGWSDPTAPPNAARVPLEQKLGDHQLYLDEIDAALGQAIADTGIGKFELVGMDACLMGHLEVYNVLQTHSRYAVASQETEPAVGWAYASFLEKLQANPNATGAELGQYIVDTYIQDDERIQDAQARAEMVGGGRGFFGAAPGCQHHPLCRRPGAADACTQRGQQPGVPAPGDQPAPGG